MAANGLWCDTCDPGKLRRRQGSAIHQGVEYGRTGRIARERRNFGKPCIAGHIRMSKAVCQ
jgi:hypothetical protein